MDSREKILSAIRKNQPRLTGLPEIIVPVAQGNDLERFKTVLISIGGAVIEADNYEQIQSFIEKNFNGKKVVSTIPELTEKTGISDFSKAPHLLANVKLAVLPGQFAVAENGALWITEAEMGDRALPYITENLALVVRKNKIVPTLHDAYEKIGAANYELGTFIAGPSKTADIEQSLVLGAHGAKSLIVFLMQV
jgi:L-lactate dehydrogenase complex protein LldG